jgi:hypothetical protein
MSASPPSADLAKRWHDVGQMTKADNSVLDTLVLIPWRLCSHQEIAAGMWRQRVTLWGFCLDALPDRS